jgi:hypothetical protein
VVYFGARSDGCHIEGWTTAIQDGATWAVEYAIDVDAAWATRSARIRGTSAGGSCEALLEADGAGHWLVDGKPGRHLDGCLDVDLEASAMTNALPVRRMALPVAATAVAPAAYVRAVGLAVERLEQTYLRTTDEASCQRYDYAAPAFDFGCRLIYDESGLVLDYPGSPSEPADRPEITSLAIGFTCPTHAASTGYPDRAPTADADVHPRAPKYKPACRINGAPP